MTREIPFWQPELGGEELSLLREVLDSNFLNDGEFTTRFERELSELLGARHVVTVTSGTAALYLALAALEIGPGDEVIVPDVTFIATANAVCMTGATPVLVDVDPQSLNILPQGIEEAITPRTRGIIPVHISGRGVDLDAIGKIAKVNDLVLIEDAAEALMSRRNGRCLGTIGAAGIVSFSPNKTITTGQGGAVLTDDERLHTRLRELKDQGRPQRGTASADVHPSVGYNFKFTNLQAAVGLAQLARLPQRVEGIRDLYRAYREGLEGVEEVRLLPFADEEVPQWVDAIVEDREELFAHLAERNIHCRRYWYPLHTQPPYRRPDELFPNSSRLIPEALWLPSAFSLTADDAAEVCRQIREFYGMRGKERVGD
jgi:perosamine synthetase